MSNTEAPKLAALLARYQQAWTEGDIEGIHLDDAARRCVRGVVRPPSVGSALRRPRRDPRRALLDMGLDRPGRSRHEYGETPLVGECAFALWTSVQEGPTGFETTMHGADFYRFGDGMVAAKIAYRKNRRS